MLLFSKKNLRLWPLLLFAAFLDWQWLSTLWSDHSTAGWKDVIMVLPIGVMGVVLHLFSLHDGTTLEQEMAAGFCLDDADCVDVHLLQELVPQRMGQL